MTTIIVAYCRGNRVMGRGNALPWGRLKGDLPRFKRVTTGREVVMGRKTWESLGSKPLPNRRNIILTRSRDFYTDGAEVFHSPTDVMMLTRCDRCVIGGGEVYAEFLRRDLVDEVLATEVAADYEGDTYFPVLGENWVKVESEGGEGYDFVTYRK